MKRLQQIILYFFFATVFSLVEALPSESYDARLKGPATKKQSKLTLDKPNTYLTLKTQNFKIHYQAKFQKYANYLATIAEKYHTILTTELGLQLDKPTNILVVDDSDFVSAYSTIYPHNTIKINLRPAIKNKLQLNYDWLRLLFIHEYIHSLMYDQNSGLPAFLNKIFGKTLYSLVITHPQLFSPIWLGEGIAVYYETKYGHGRGKTGYYESIMKTEVLQGVRDIYTLTYISIFPELRINNYAYLYGYYFFKFLEEVYGLQKIIDYINETNDNVIPYRIDNRSKEVFGLNSVELWESFKSYLNEKFAPEINATQKNMVRGNLLSNKLNTELFTFDEVGKVYAYYWDEIGRGWLTNIDQGKIIKLRQMDTVVALLWYKKNQLLLIKDGDCDDKNLNDLFLYDLQNKKEIRLTRCQRINEIATLEDGTILANQFKDNRFHLISLKILLPELGPINEDGFAQGIKIQQIHTFEFDEILGEIDAKGDKNILANIYRNGTGWNIEEYNLQTTQWHQFSNDGLMTKSPKYIKEEEGVIFIGDNGKSVEIYTYENKYSKHKKVTNGIAPVASLAATTINNQTNAIFTTKKILKNGQINYALRGIVVDHELIPSTEMKNYPAVYERFSIEDLPANNSTPDYTTYNYSVFESIGPTGWTPFFATYNNVVNFVGFYIEGSDVRENHKWRLLLSQSPSITKTSYEFHYDYADNFKMINSVDYNQQPSYVLKTEKFQISFKFSNIKPIYFAETSVSENLEQKQTAHSSSLGINYSPLVEMKDYPYAIQPIGYFVGFELETYPSENLGGTRLKTNFSYSMVNPYFTKEYFDFGLIHTETKGVTPDYFFESDTTFNNAGTTTKVEVGKTTYNLIGLPLTKFLTAENFTLLSVGLNHNISRVNKLFLTPPVGLSNINNKIWLASLNLRGDETEHYRTAGVEFIFEILIGYAHLTVPLKVGMSYGDNNKDYKEANIYTAFFLNLVEVNR